MSLTEILPASVFQLNVEGLVASVMAVEQQPLTGLQTDQNTLSRRSATLSDLKSALSALRSKAQALTQAGTLSPFQVKAVSSSSATVAMATASPSALAAVHTLSVSQLAKLSTVVSQQLTGSATDVVTTEGIGTKSVKITYDGTDPATSGTAVTVNVTLNAGDTNDTILTNLATTINSDSTLGAKISASVVNDTATTARLVLTSKQTGQANKVRVADATGSLLSTIGLNSGIASTGTAGGFLYADTALDAKFTLDGLAMTRSSNSISDVLTGVTINLLGLSASDMTLTVSADKTSMKASVQAFLDAYNKALTFLRERTLVQVSATTSGARSTTVNSVIRGPLAGEMTYRSLVSNLRSDVGSSVSSVQTGNPALLADIGITAASNGTLSISDTTKFDSAIETKLSGLTDLFASTGGVATRLMTRLDGFVNSGGLIDGSLSTATSKAQNINQQITRLQDRLVIREAALRKQLLDLQKALSALSAQRFILQ
ncbi:flagellar filament capping protein FliD [Candidatus Methylomirabilis sp.]|uniref:flagellar filament capping protein FliD n=1 Tax=Candidatus Methylomirabilis sp. TaxID=2032687 RepID=UPI002A5F885C|nr:flagellar filament capping protein FliD [Candidatus Methylomirabilis sp.]